MTLLDVYPIKGYMYFFRKYTHKYTENRVEFHVLGCAQNSKCMTRDQNRIDFLTIMQLVATSQHLALFAILKFVNAHTNYFDRSITNQKLAA